jgi:glycosyltransferase involved in cell wall biosynthesis
VVIDDNTSKDGTPELIENKFSNDSRLKIFRNKEDLNIPLGWSRAISHATGDFFLLLHSDNLLHPQFAEKMMNAIESSDAKVAYSECNYFTGSTPNDLFSLSKSKSENYSVLSPGPRAVDYVFRYQRMIPTSCLVFSKDCIKERAPYNHNFKWDPDIELMIYLVSHFRTVHFEENLCAIRTHDGQAASWKDPTFSVQYETLLKETNQKAKSEPHHFLLHWAGSNQDVCDKLSLNKKASWSTYLKYQLKWWEAELKTFLFFTAHFLRKVKLMIRYLFRRLVNP